MKKFLLTLFTVAIFTVPLIYAQKNEQSTEMTLSGVIKEVKDNNPSLAAARRQLSLLEADELISSAYANPNIEIEKSASGGPAGYEVKASQPVPLTRRTGKAKAAARTAFEAAKKELEALENLTLSSARKAWYALHIAKERRNFEETNLRFSMDILNKIEMRLQTGEAGNADLSRAKVETARSGYRLQDADTMLSAAMGELNELMGRRPELPVHLPENGGFSLIPVPSPPEPLEKYTELALAGRPEMSAAALRGKAADLSLALEKYRRIPVPEIGLMYGSDSGTGYSKLFLGFELPLWYNSKGEIKKALAQKSITDCEAKRAEMRIRAEAYTAWLELGLARKRLAAAREIVVMLNDLRRTAAQDYLSGKIDLSAFYETNRVFLEENINYLDALKGYYEKTAQMSAATNSWEEQ